MIEILAFALGLVVVIMGWGYVSRTLNWVGERGEVIGVVADDLLTSAVDQTARAQVISHESLKDTVLEAQKKSIKRAKAREAFLAQLSEEGKKEVAKETAYTDALLNRTSKLWEKEDEFAL